MAFDLTSLLTFAKEAGASDVHVSAGTAPLLRIRGKMTPVEMPPLSSDDARSVLFDILNDAQKNCLVNQREVGPHTESFTSALRGALREDPDVILVGELRDLETTSLAISAAETGHLVLATLHTNSASKTIDRIIDIFPSGAQAQIRTMLSESLEGVVAQSLLPSKDGKSRVAALEVLVGVPALRNLIREDKTAQIRSVIQTGASHGMQSLDQSLRDLVMQGRLSREDAMRKSSNPKLFEGAQGGPVATPAPGATASPAGGPA